MGPGVFAPIGEPLFSTRPNFGAAGEEKGALRFTEPVTERPFEAFGVSSSSLYN